MSRSVYPWVAVIFLVVGFVPTVNSFYKGLPELPRQVAYRMPEVIDGMSGRASSRKAKRTERIFRTDDWAERIYADSEDRRYTSFVARGLDPRPLFHLPENGLLDRGWTQRDYSLEPITFQGKTYPVHRLVLKGVASTQFVYYLLVYKDEPIGHPFWQLFASVPETLLYGRAPYTLIFVSAPGTDQGIRRNRALKILFQTAERMTQSATNSNAAKRAMAARNMKSVRRAAYTQRLDASGLVPTVCVQWKDAF